jgi:hypothetical protein
MENHCQELNRYDKGICGKPVTAVVIRYAGFQRIPVCAEHEADYRRMAETTRGMSIEKENNNDTISGREPQP